MKNIWIINQYASPPKYGSITRHHYLAKYIDNKKYKVYIITSSAIHNSDVNMIKDNKKFKILQIDGINYVYIKTCQYKKNNIKRILNILQYYFRLAFLKKKISKKIGRPDYVYASSPMPTSALMGIKIAKKFNSKSIVEIRDIWPDSVIDFGIANKKNFFVKILYKIEKKLYIKSDKLLFTMAGGKEFISTKKYCNKVNYSKIYNLNNGVDIEQYDYNLKKYNYKDPYLDDKKIFKLLYTGGIRESYNIKDILNLGKKIQNKGYKNVVIMLFGNGNETNKMKNYCKDNNITNVIFNDFVDNKYIPSIMSKCNICLLHGKNVEIFKYGTSQNKLFAYLYSGKPIISCFNNKYDIIEPNKCGITLKNGTINEYFQAFKKIYDNYDLKKTEYKTNDYRVLKMFDYKNLSKILVEIIEDKI